MVSTRKKVTTKGRKAKVTVATVNKLVKIPDQDSPPRKKARKGAKAYLHADQYDSATAGPSGFSKNRESEDLQKNAENGQKVSQCSSRESPA